MLKRTAICIVIASFGSAVAHAEDNFQQQQTQLQRPVARGQNGLYQHAPAPPSAQPQHTAPTSYYPVPPRYIYAPTPVMEYAPQQFTQYQAPHSTALCRSIRAINNGKTTTQHKPKQTRTTKMKKILWICGRMLQCMYPIKK